MEETPGVATDLPLRPAQSLKSVIAFPAPKGFN
jgi:hypothetical protein